MLDFITVDSRGVNSILTFFGGYQRLLPCETRYCRTENEIYNKTYLKQQKCSGDKFEMVKD